MALHDDFLATLTRERYLKFRHMYIQSFSASSPSHHEPYKHQVKKGPQRKAFFSQQEEISDDDEYAEYPGVLVDSGTNPASRGAQRFSLTLAPRVADPYY